jgi:hypothetical protein
MLSYETAATTDEESAGAGSVCASGADPRPTPRPTTKTLQHFDLYRLDTSAQLDDIDYFGYLESDAVSVVEWGDKFSDALPLDYIEIALQIDDAQPDTRILQSLAHGPRATRLLKAWTEPLTTQGLAEKSAAHG